MLLYCGEVNSRNGFGGMTGFEPVTAVLQSDLPKSWGSYQRGDVYLYDGEWSGMYYFDCVRPDTQRSEKDFGVVLPFATPERIDAQFRPISNAVAPELR
jgi:hypothetical protein